MEGSGTARRQCEMCRWCCDRNTLSAMCAKLRTVAASNNRDHTPRSLYYCLLAPHIYCCSSRTSRSWWITHSTQRHRKGCNNIPSFSQRTAPIARSLCEGWTRHDLHILVTAPFCCDRKSSSGMWAKLRTVAASNSRYHTPRSLYYCLIAPHIYIVVLHVHPVRGESHIQRNATGEVATMVMIKHLFEVSSGTNVLSLHICLRYGFETLFALDIW